MGARALMVLLSSLRLALAAFLLCLRASLYSMAIPQSYSSSLILWLFNDCSASFNNSAFILGVLS